MIPFTTHQLFYTTIYHTTPNRGLNNAVRKVSQSEKFYSDDDDVDDVDDDDDDDDIGVGGGNCLPCLLPAFAAQTLTDCQCMRCNCCP